MTGYGSHSIETASATINVEVKTLNSKFLDANIRLPKEIGEKEIEIRNIISEYLKRGKVSISIDIFRSATTETALSFDESLFALYYDKLSSLADSVSAPKDDLFRTILAYPDVVVSNQSNVTDEIWKQIKDCVVGALKNCNDFRKQEGEAMGAKLEGYIKSIQSSFEEIVKLDPQRITNIKDRIRNNLEETIGIDKVDENRFEQELIYYIEKIDITEEKVRLGNHLSYFLKTMGEKEPPGKKLGFISQEIGREINTIGSKANDSDIQKFVVAMKDDLEKVKEQSLNIL